MTNKKLWQQVAAFRFDDDQSALTFSQRLARENGWSLAFAGRVIEEYRRFIYLAACAGHAVTPSDEVDQAWHLHMVYTRSYWQDLCEGVLGQPLHHGPTKGGQAEGEKFHNWYERTLASYRREFEAEPPRDIWPPSEVRFSVKARFQRIDTSQVWMLPKGKLKRALSLGLGATALMLALMACSSSSGGGFSDLWPIACLAGLVILLILSAKKPPGNGNGNGKKPDGSSSCGGGFSSFLGCSSSSSGGHSGCGSHGCGSDGGSSGCGSSCGSGCGGGCGGGGD